MSRNGESRSNSDSDTTTSDTKPNTRPQKRLDTAALTLPQNVSKWSRKHAEKIGIFYAKGYVIGLEELRGKINGNIRECTKSQKKYIKFVNEHLTFNLSIKHFYQQGQNAESVAENTLALVEKDLLKDQNEHDKEESWYYWMVRCFISDMRYMLRDMRDFKKKVFNTHPAEGFLTSLIGSFASLCCLRVQYCSRAYQAAWCNLDGVPIVTSEPDLRLYKRGTLGEHCEYSDTVASVMEVKASANYSEDPMPPPSKKSKRSSKSSCRSDTETEMCMSEAVELDLPDMILGQHAGQLLLDLHIKYKDKEINTYKEDKKINMLGMIIEGSSVFFTVLTMSWKHYQNLKHNKDLDDDDKATIHYSVARDVLLEQDRRTLIADFIRLNNLE